MMRRVIFKCVIFLELIGAFFSLHQPINGEVEGKVAYLTSGANGLEGRERAERWNEVAGRFGVSVDMVPAWKVLDKKFIDSYSAVIFELIMLTPAEARALERYVRRGGILWVIGGKNVAIAYDKLGTHVYDVKNVIWGWCSTVEGTRWHILPRATRAARGEEVPIRFVTVIRNNPITRSLPLNTPIPIKPSAAGKPTMAPRLVFCTSDPTKSMGGRAIMVAGPSKERWPPVIMTCNPYGRGLGYSLTIDPLSRKEPLFAKLVENFFKLTVTREHLKHPIKGPALTPFGPKLRLPTSATPVPAKHVSVPAGGSAVLDAMDMDCYSKSRIGWAGDETGNLLYRNDQTLGYFRLNDTSKPIRLDFWGVSGDHHELVTLEIIVNGRVVCRPDGLWKRINYQQFKRKDKNAWSRFSVCLAPEYLRSDNTVILRNLGPDWCVLDRIDIKQITTEQLAHAIDAVSNDESTIRVTHLSEPPAIDGRLDDLCWEKVPARTLVSEAEFFTTFRVACDRTYLYVAFDAAEPEKDLLQQARVGKGMMSDMVQVILQDGVCGSFLYRFTVGSTGEYFADWPAMDHPFYPDWRAARAVGSKGYSVEMAIPLACINFGLPLYTYYPKARTFLPTGVSIRANFLRRRQRRYLQQWSWRGFRDAYGRMLNKIVTRMVVAPVYRVYDPAIFGKLVCIKPADKQISCRLDGAVQLGTNRIVFQGKPNSPSAVPYVWVRPVKPIEGSLLQPHWSSMLPDRKGYRIELNSPGENDLFIRWVTSSGTIVQTHYLSVNVISPLTMCLDRNYYTSERRARVVLGYRGGDIQDAELVLGDLLNPLVKRTVKVEKLRTMGQVKVDLPIESLEPGDYQVNVRYQGPDGRWKALKSVILRKRHAHKGEVKIRSDGFLLIDGKPFFPFGAYFGGTNYEDASECGFNTVILWNSGISAKDREKFYTDAAKDGHIRIIDTHLGLYGGIQEIEPNCSKMAKVIIKDRTRQALMGYYLVDEPEYLHKPMLTSGRLRSIDRFIKTLDPYHLTVISNGIPDVEYRSRNTPSYNDAVDINIIQAYGDCAYVARRMEQGRLAKREGRRAWFWTAIRTLVPVKGFGSTSPQQLWANIHVAINHGSRGIILFDWKRCSRGLPDICPEFTSKIASHLKRISPIIFARPFRHAVYVDDPNIDWSARVDGKNIFIIAVNTMWKSKKVRFALKDVQINNIEVVNEDRNLRAEKKNQQTVFADSFAPLAVHIYKINSNKLVKENHP